MMKVDNFKLRFNIKCILANKDAVIIEKEFITDSISCDMIGMNVTLMSQYTYQFGHTVYYLLLCVLNVFKYKSYKLVTYILSNCIRI